jgi:EmrB/QacA subfamily drug resistance transporter
MERHWKVLLLISVGSFAAFLDAPVVSIAFPAISKEFPESSPTMLAWVLDGYFIAFATFPVFGGKLADRYGRDRVFLSGVAAFTIASVVAGAAPSAGVLIAARVAQGLAAGFMYPAGQSLMLAAFPPERRKMAIGVLAAVVGLAIAISPTVGGALVDGLGWRWIFYINLALGVPALLYGVHLLRGSEHPTIDTPFPDTIGALLQGGSVGLLVLVILKYNDWGLGSPQSIAAIAVAMVATPVFLARSRRHPSPVIDVKLFRERAFAMGNVGSMLLAVAFYGIVINSVLFMTHVWGYSLVKTGVTFVPGALIGAVVGGPSGKISETRGPRVVAGTGALCAAAGLIYIVIAAGAEPHYVRDWLPGQLLYSGGATAAITALLGAAVTAAPPAEYANASGVNLTFRQIGGAVGVALTVAVTSGTAGTILDRTDTVFLIGAIACTAGAVSSLALRRPSPAGVPQPSAAPVLSASQTGPPTPS